MKLCHIIFGACSMRRFIVTTVCLTLCTSHTIFSYKALVIVPVADLVGSPLKGGATAYKHLPVCGSRPNAFTPCKRLHQLLFNEIVDVVEEDHEQVQVAVPYLFFVSNGTNKKQNTYWTLKKNLYPLPTDSAIRAAIPQTADFGQSTVQQPNTVTLILPFHDPVTKLTFSAGTRFVVESTNEENATVNVFVLHPTTHTITVIAIPQKLCLIPASDKEHQRKNFVKLVRLWAHNGNGIIPYVWGGCSMIFTTPQLTFNETCIKNHTCHYEINDNDAPLKTGFDCAGLVTRAAQAVGLPYYYKNTTTLASHLTPLTSGQHLHDGDLIWTPGHVMIVSNRDHNLLVEACGYASGWGRVREVPMNHLFKNIETCTDLETLFENKQPLKRIDKTGNVSSTYATFKLLALDSIWR